MESGWVGPILKATIATVVGGLIIAYFYPASPPSQPGPAAVPAPPDPATAWNYVMNSCDLEDLYAFRDRYTNDNSYYYNMVDKRIRLILNNDPSSPCLGKPTTPVCTYFNENECINRAYCNWNEADRTCNNY